MAIEPMSSAMTYQAQNTTIIQPVKAETNYMDNSDSNTMQQVDTNTAAVNKVDKKDNGNANEQNQNQNQNQSQQASQEQIKKAVEQLNKKMSNSEALFGIHEGTNRITIKIVDRQTKEVIKELPPEKTLDMIAKVWELAGLMVDEKR